MIATRQKLVLVIEEIICLICETKLYSLALYTCKDCMALLLIYDKLLILLSREYFFIFLFLLLSKHVNYMIIYF